MNKMNKNKLAFRVFWDKDVKPYVPRIPCQLGNCLLGGSPKSEEHINF